MSIQKVQLLIICLFIPLLGFGQLNEFAPLDAKWKFFHEGADSFPDWYYEIIVEGDTLIQDKQCRILKYSESGLIGPVESKEIIYTEENQVYIYRDSLFYLVFDFDAEVGDTIVVFEDNFKPFFHVSFEEDSSFIELHNYFAYKIVEIDSINRAGNWLKHQLVEGIGDWRINNVIEYFGAVRPLGYGSHLFGESNHLFSFGDGQFDLMYCYEEEDIELPVSSNYDCLAQAVGINNDIDLENKISLYPNPASTVISLEYEQEFMNETFRLYNSLGEIMLEQNLSNNRVMNIPLNQVMDGMYYWQLGSAYGKLVVRK